MKLPTKLLNATLMTLGLLCASSAALALPTVIDFNAVALRGANDGGGNPVGNPKPVVSEYANGNGASITNPYSGQKAYYGTSYFGGATLGSIDKIVFTYKPAGGPDPYINLTITNGSTVGVLTQGFSATPTTVNNGDGSITATYDLSALASFRLVEQTGAAQVFGTAPTFGDIQNWTFLVADRTPSAGELSAWGDPRAPISDSLAIVWGDSSNNYQGTKEIYDVHVMTQLVTGAPGEEFVAGITAADVPEPASLALVGVALLGAVAARRRAKA